MRSVFSVCSICPVFRSLRASLVHCKAGSIWPKFSFPFWNAMDKWARCGRTLCSTYSVEMNLALLMFFSRPYAIASDSGKLLRVSNTAERSSKSKATELLKDTHLVLQAFFSFLKTFFCVFLFRSKLCILSCVFMYAFVRLDEFSILCQSCPIVVAMWSTYFNSWSASMQASASLWQIQCMLLYHMRAITIELCSQSSNYPSRDSQQTCFHCFRTGHFTRECWASVTSKGSEWARNSAQSSGSQQ